jgi:hypothetical protein
MSAYEDYDNYLQDEALSKFIDEELRRLADVPVFQYLAQYGDAIEGRVRNCLSEARALVTAGFDGAALVRAAAGTEIVIRFFLARPLVPARSSTVEQQRIGNCYPRFFAIGSLTLRQSRSAMDRSCGRRF